MLPRTKPAHGADGDQPRRVGAPGSCGPKSNQHSQQQHGPLTLENPEVAQATPTDRQHLGRRKPLNTSSTFPIWLFVLAEKPPRALFQETLTIGCFTFMSEFLLASLLKDNISVISWSLVLKERPAQSEPGKHPQRHGFHSCTVPSRPQAST